MQITEKELIQIISEEIDKMVENDEIDEGVLDRLKAQAAGATATLNPFATQGDATLKKAASTMNSYSNHLLKLQQKLAMDAQKLGIDGVDDIESVSNAIAQTQQKVQNIAKTAPTSEKFKAAVQRAVADQSGSDQQQAAPAADDQQQAAPAADDQQQAAPAADDQQQAAAQPQARALDDRLQAWVDGGKQPGNFNANSARAAIGTSRMGQRAGKAVFNSQEALEFGKQVAAALGDGARTGPLRQAIQDTEDVGIANEPVNEETHRQLMSEFDAWELQFESKGKTLNEQLQKISERWGFGK